MFGFFKKRQHDKNNKKQLDKLGKNTSIPGKIIKRKAGALIEIGDDCLIEGVCVTETVGARLSIGNNVYIGGGTVLDCVNNIVIEDDILMAGGTLVMDSDNHSIHYSDRKKDLADWKNDFNHDWSTTNTKNVILRKGCWIGAKCIILKGVEVGEGAVVAAGSVVTKNVEPYTVYAGNPAKFIKKIEKKDV